MNISPKRQSQFELFPRVSKNAPEAGQLPRLTKDLTLSLENIIVLCIIFIVTLVVCFSFGVERGKQVALVPDAQNAPGVIRTSEIVVEEPRPAKTVRAAQEEKRVVFPVEMPQEVLEESEPAFQPPVEKADEQENLFTIQVASFKLEKNAQREANRLKGIGHDEAFVVPKGSYSIVCVGKFAQRTEAKRLSGKLKKRYNDCLVRRL